MIKLAETVNFSLAFGIKLGKMRQPFSRVFWLVLEILGDGCLFLPVAMQSFIFPKFDETPEEKEIWLEYCSYSARSQNDVFRDYLRTLAHMLSKKGASNPFL